MKSVRAPDQMMRNDILPTASANLSVMSTATTPADEVSVCVGGPGGSGSWPSESLAISVRLGIG
jgi:tRNA A37 threonylcarbamoyladenosine dehydratase